MFFSFNDKSVINIMTNAMHTMYILTCSVSVKIYRRKNRLQLQFNILADKMWQPIAIT